MPDSNAADRTIVNVPAVISCLADSLAPFVHAWNALPEDVRGMADRDLADVLGIFKPDNRPALKIGDLAGLMIVYAVLSPDGAGATEADIIRKAVTAAAADDEPVEQKCRECGFTNKDFTGADAFLDPHTQRPILWHETDLCSACAPAPVTT